MKAITLADAEVLIPNNDHKNFTFSGQIIKEGTNINGEEVYINGLRRGEPWVYRLFKTDNNQLIYLNKVKTMPTTEVKLGADAGQTTTVVNFKPAEMYSKAKMYGAIGGGIAGFDYAKFKKHDMKKSAMFIGIGAVVGYAAGYFLDTQKDVTVIPSK